jgi:hypothetical protein
MFFSNINMLQVTDRSKEIIGERVKIPQNLEKIVIKANSPISLDLIDWENAGLRIGVVLEGFGSGFFNEKPYADREIALREYKHVLEQVQKGNYSLELYGHNELKLSLTDSK